MKENDFKDRVPLHPGRVRLTPVEGQDNIYDMARADEPTEEGTPLNKATLDSISRSRLTGRYYDLVATIDNDASNIAYTTERVPAVWDIGQRITVQTPELSYAGIASNTFMGIACNTILLPLRRYELVYNGSSFDALEISAPVPNASYLAFVGNINTDMVDAAFGKGNEDLVSGVGEALAMYGWYKGIDSSDYPFPNLRNMRTVNDANYAVFGEVVKHDKLFEFVAASSYASNKFFTTDHLTDGRSYEYGSWPSEDHTAKLDIDVTSGDLENEYFRMSYTLRQEDANAELWFWFNGVQIEYINTKNQSWTDDDGITREKVFAWYKWADFGIAEPGTYTLEVECNKSYYANADVTMYRSIR